MTEKYFMNKLNEKLQEHGYKMTSQRVEILKYMINNEQKHLSSEEIYDGIKEYNPNIGLATIYRTLQLFVDVGILSKVDFNDGRSRYELIDNEDVHNHHHLICVNCGKIYEVEEFENNITPTLEKAIEKDYNFKILNHSIKFYGLCEKCNKDV